MGSSPFPYIIPIVPCSLPTELIKGEHFVHADLFKLVPGSSSHVVFAQEDQAKATKGTLVRSARVSQPQSPPLAPQSTKKRKETRARKTKAVGDGLEDFVDWMGVVASELVKREEMFNLATGFAVRMSKWAVGPEGEATSTSKGKRSRRFPPDEGAQKDWAIVSMESPDQASKDQPALKDCPNEVGASLKKGVPVVSSLNIEEVRERAPSGVVTAPVLPPKPASTELNKKWLPDRVLLSTYVPPLERIHPSMGMVAPNPEGVLEIVHRWSPFNQVESPVVHMHELYPNYFQILVAAHIEQYTILLHVYMDKEAFHPVAEDGMLIRNHDFHRSAE